MSKKKKDTPSEASSSDTSPEASSLACLRLGWAMIGLFLALGLVLESFHLVKLPFYLDIRLRRELWTLAHTHGTLLGVVNVLFGLSAARFVRDPARLLLASKLVRVGAVLVPAGFLLGGLLPAEGDPSLFIVLVPVGALLALWGVGMVIVASRT